jgi:hypothetical protein
MWPGSDQTTPGEKGVGLCKALNGYAKWSKEVMIPGCKSASLVRILSSKILTSLVPDCTRFGYWTNPRDIACFDSYNASSPLFTDLTLGNSINRQWNWFLCNEP